jgi:hypothetical protein
MKNDLLTALPVLPEEYDLDNYNRIKEYQNSEMVVPSGVFCTVSLDIMILKISSKSVFHAAAQLLIS